MRFLTMFLLAFLPMLVSAQRLTETQKQEALQSATQFCNLLTRFSNGERTLNSQINALCSGADCSAFDDIKTNKEITLRNYLFAIQTKYPDKLPMTITAPSLANSKTYFEYEFSLGSEFANLSNDGNILATGEVTTISAEGTTNSYVVFNIFQEYPTLGKSVGKELVYDVKNKKITAFITNNGSYIRYLNGLMAIANKDYQTAMSCFDSAAQNERFPLKKRCYACAMICCIYSLNFDTGIHYAKLFGDPIYVELLELINRCQKEQFDSLYPHVTKLATLVETRTDLDNNEKGGIYVELGNIYASPLYPYQDLKKGAYYFEKAMELGFPNAGCCIFMYYTLFGDDFVSDEVALNSLKQSAQSGYPPAFYYYGVIKDGIGETDEAQQLFEKSAESGNYIAMACLGKLLIEKGDKTDGINWLKKALTCPNLDEKIELDGFGDWPKSRADVQTLLNKYENSTVGHTTPSYSDSSHTSASSSSSYPSAHTTASTHSSSSNHHSSSGSSYSSYSSYSSSSHSSRKFNEAKDNFCAGFSVGYVRKQWVYDYGDEKVKMDVFGDGEYTNGIQVGFRIDEQYGYGLGVNTGLYYEYYFGRSNESNDGYFKLAEHSLYLPVHFKYNLNFSRWFQIGLYGGIGLDYGVSGKIYYCCDGEDYEPISMYDKELDMKRFNASLEYGGSIRIRRFQVNCTFSRGLVNMSGSDEYKVKLNKILSISASVCF